jgi:cell division transport system permease protein
MYFKNKLNQYLLSHLQASVSSLGQLSRSPFNTLMTCLIIGIALALPMTLFVLLKNVDVLGGKMRQNIEVTLFLKADANEEQAQQVLQLVNKNTAITEAHIVSPNQGLHELQQTANVDNVIIELKDNPLPWSIVALPSINVHTAEALAELNHTLKQLPDVEEVQMDAQWIQRLFTMLTLAHRAVYAISIFLGLAVLLIINNCIRTATQNNKKEIEIIKLIGGTHNFIRRPFLYAGMIYGLLGGIIAWQMVDLFILWIKEPAHQLATLYQSQFNLLGISLTDTFTLLGSSIALGLIGAWLAVTRHLYRPQI